jgi:hypothetical protein
VERVIPEPSKTNPGSWTSNASQASP